MAAIAQDWACHLLRACATLLQGFADRIEAPAMRSLPLEPLRVVDCADERIRERRNQVFLRYY